MIMRGCSVEECEERAEISCDDLQVVGCGGSGVCASINAYIKLSGQGTNIQRNVTKGGRDDY